MKDGIKTRHVFLDEPEENCEGVVDRSSEVLPAVDEDGIAGEDSTSCRAEPFQKVHDDCFSLVQRHLTLSYQFDQARLRMLLPGPVVHAIEHVLLVVDDNVRT